MISIKTLTLEQQFEVAKFEKDIDSMDIETLRIACKSLIRIQLAQKNAFMQLASLESLG
jgi:CHAT domain-containing protein